MPEYSALSGVNVSTLLGGAIEHEADGKIVHATATEMNFYTSGKEQEVGVSFST